MNALSLRPTRFLMALAVAAAAVSAMPDVAPGGEIYTGWTSKRAIDGFDAVTYHRDGRPLPGRAEISYRWKDATWLFATEANKAAFIAAPERYAPQYGGHCSWAAAQGYTAKGDPLAWKIVGGRLFLNYDADVHATWQQDIDGNVRKADGNWPRLRGG